MDGIYIAPLSKALCNSWSDSPIRTHTHSNDDWLPRKAPSRLVGSNWGVGRLAQGRVDTLGAGRDRTGDPPSVLTSRAIVSPPPKNYQDDRGCSRGSRVPRVFL